MAAENFPVGQRLRSAALTARNEQSPPLRGLWLSSSSPACATTLARLRRLDFLIVDWEHGDGGLDRGQVDFLVREIFAQSQSRTAPIVRLPSRGAVWTKWALDAGARGIVVPQINTDEEAKQVVRDARYPPLGARSFGPSGALATLTAVQIPSQDPRPEPAAAAGGASSMLAYYSRVAPEILVAVQIESCQGLANVEAIAAVQGIDALFIGPVDLRISLGLVPALDGEEPAWNDAVDRIAAAAQKHGRALSTVTDGKPASVEKWSKRGFGLITVGSDLALLSSSTENLFQSLQ